MVEVLRAAVELGRKADSAAGHCDVAAAQLLCELNSRLAQVLLAQGNDEDADFAAKQVLQVPPPLLR